jgi:mannose-1-phosphate guanylyltransferase
MQALILAGGEGTRLRPLTHTVAKPVLPLVGRPHIAYVIDWLARHGVDDVIVSCGHLAEGMRKVLDSLELDVRIRFAEEPDARGTAGAIRFADDMLADRFFVLNGDVLCDLDLTAQLQQHESTGARATLALYPVEDPTGYGLIHRHDDGEITEFLEKPEPDQIDTDEINAGAYLLERSVLDEIPPDRAVSIEREVFPRLIGDGSRIGDGALIERSVLLDGCAIEENAALRNSILSSRVTVGKGTELEGAVIGEGDVVQGVPAA